jgi:hypothetical protein
MFMVDSSSIGANGRCKKKQGVVMKNGNGVFALGVLMMGAMVVAPGVSSASMPDNLGFEDGLAGWTVGDNYGSAASWNGSFPQGRKRGWTVGDNYGSAASWNGSFPQGRKRGRTVVDNDGSAAAVKSYVDDYSGYFANFGPVEGEQFLLLDNASSGQGVTVSQTFDLAKGAELSGSYAFYAPTLTFDFAAVTITREGSTSNMLGSASFLTNMYVGQGWHHWMWSAEESATYTLSYVLYNVPLFGNAQSFAMFDAPAVLESSVAPVPVPGAALLLFSGLMGLAGAGVRKKKNGIASFRF